MVSSRPYHTPWSSSLLRIVILRLLVAPRRRSLDFLELLLALLRSCIDNLFLQTQDVGLSTALLAFVLGTGDKGQSHVPRQIDRPTPQPRQPSCCPAPCSPRPAFLTPEPSSSPA